MSAHRNIWILSLVAAFFLLTAAGALGAGEDASGPLLPENMVIKDAYTPGIGLPVGKILLVQGKVVVYHAAETTGYYAKNNNMLFKGDTIVTLDRGRVRLKLDDDSIMTLASETRLVINQSVYNPENKTRSSFIGMDKGKARFLIKKLVDFKHSEFKVKTNTAVAGVRGSEFIIRATDVLTEITTLEDTRLEVVSLAMPCPDFKGYPPPPECRVKPVFLTDFQKTVVRIDEMPAEVQVVDPVEIGQIEGDFTVTPDVPVPEGTGDMQPETPGAGPAPADSGPVLVSPDVPVEPEAIAPPPEPAIPSGPQLPVDPLATPGEDLIEDELKGALPDFPPFPE